MQGVYIKGADLSDETPLTFIIEAEFLIAIAEVDAPDRRRAQAPQDSGPRYTTDRNLDEAR